MVSFPQVSPPKPWIHLSSPPPHTCYMPTHLIILNLITQVLYGEVYRSFNYSLCSFLHSHVTSSLLGLNILLNTLLSNTLCLHSSLSVRDQVSHPYKTIHTDMLHIFWHHFFKNLSDYVRTWNFFQHGSATAHKENSMHSLKHSWC